MADTSKPKLKLVGEDDNALAILARAVRALKEAGQEDKVGKFMDQATRGDYDHLLRAAME